MGKIIVLLLALSLIVERVTEKILYLFPSEKKRVYAWLVSTILGLVISFSFQFGFIKELGWDRGMGIGRFVDFFLTGLLIACGSEPIHSIVDGLALKRDALKRKLKDV